MAPSLTGATTTLGTWKIPREEMLQDFVPPFSGEVVRKRAHKYLNPHGTLLIEASVSLGIWKISVEEIPLRVFTLFVVLRGPLKKRADE